MQWTCDKLELNLVFTLGSPAADKLYAAFIAAWMAAAKESIGNYRDLTPLMIASCTGEAHSY